MFEAIDLGYDIELAYHEGKGEVFVPGYITLKDIANLGKEYPDYHGVGEITRTANHYNYVYGRILRERDFTITIGIPLIVDMIDSKLAIEVIRRLNPDLYEYLEENDWNLRKIGDYLR
jgi:hypothetical protein